MNKELIWRLDASETLWHADAVGLYDGYSDLLYEVFIWQPGRERDARAKLWVCRLLWTCGPGDVHLGPTVSARAGKRICQLDYEMRNPQLCHNTTSAASESHAAIPTTTTSASAQTDVAGATATTNTGKHAQ